MTEFRMPTLGSDMEAGTLVEWLKKPGDPLKRGDIIAVVDTEKGAIEIEVFEDGVLEHTLVVPGQQVPVGTVLALIRSSGEPGAPSLTPPVLVPLSRAPAVLASPGARRAAEAAGIDLASISGTGPDGAITREDVARAASVGGPAPTVAQTRSAVPTATAETTSTDKAAAMRSAIAGAMSRSKREIPHLYLSTTIDMTGALGWLSTENQRRSVDERLLPVTLLLKAVARAAVEVPGLNGFWVDGAFKPVANVHLGCAISLRGGGLVAPALHDADRKTIGELMTELTDLVARARRGTLRSSELADPTLTVTNLGDLGVEQAYAVIYPPQVAIVAFGKLVERPWVREGLVEVRTVVTATVSADHRAVDGRLAGQFLSGIDRALQMAEQL